ncbi:MULTISPECIES: GIY-YIG nuclease family protein [Nocardia]|uniref:GIY-YIG nuclease family protein n=2 Tax=Nocardiaceae TaxID=85025 RepID=UPI0024551E50|nr:MULTISPECIES: GIY-YIG nuclease family protein [Nocardia]
MGYVYGFRHGTEDLFKIGQTTATPDKRRSTLQTNCAQPLMLFDAIETDEYKALEKYVKDTWAEQRSVEGGSEIYHLTEDQATELFARCRVWLAEELPKLRQIEQLEDIEPELTLLSRDPAAEALRNQWIELHDQEQRLKQKYEQAAAERERVETELKLAIGTHAGIDGVATWETAVKSRRINPGLVQAREPELFEKSLEPKLNAEKFKALLKALGRGDDYDSFQEIRHTRKFKITE